MKYTELLKTERPCPFDNPKQEDVVVENETAYLTYALAAYHIDQMLVVPKRHVVHFDDITDAELDDCHTLQKLGWHILRELGHGGVSFLLREGESTGKSVPHLHYNLMPDTKLGYMPPDAKEERNVMNAEEVIATVARMREALAQIRPTQ